MIDHVFIETTIQIERNFSQEYESINRKLSDKTLCTSTYVFGEYARSLLQDAVTFYNLLEQSENTREALYRLREVLFSTRQYDRVLRLLADIFEDDNMSKAEVAKRLRLLIEDIIVSRFNRSIKVLIDDTGCQRARAFPEFDNGLCRLRAISCRQEPKPSCRMATYIDERRSMLERISRLADENLQPVTRALCECLSGRALPYGRRCWHMGDAIIGCEVPEDVQLYTTNKKDYVPICAAIGRTLLE